MSGLASGAALLLYDGHPLSAAGNILWDYAEQERMTQFGASAKYLSACAKAGLRPAARHQLGALRAILSTGSPLAPETFDYVYRDIKQDVQLSSISGGTDIVSCFVLGNPNGHIWFIFTMIFNSNTSFYNFKVHQPTIRYFFLLESQKTVSYRLEDGVLGRIPC